MIWKYAVLLFIVNIPKYPGGKFHQNEYTITIDRVVATYMNKKYCKGVMKTFKYNRTLTSFNGTLITYYDIKTSRVFLTGYKRDGNDYKKTAVQSNFNLCMLLRIDFAGISIAKSSNGNFTNCPLKKGTYVIYNFYFDRNKSPPGIPEGEWKFTADIMGNSILVGSIDVYVSIKYPIVKS